MSQRIIIFVFALVAAGGRAAVGFAQEAEYLQQQIDVQAGDVERRASELLQSLTRFPKETRDAALVVAQRPDLVVGLAIAGDDFGITANRTAARVGDARITEACSVLVRYPDAVRLLHDDLLSAGLLGRAFAAQPEACRAALDGMSERAREMEAASAAAWRERLSADADAASQLSRAAQGWSGQISGEAGVAKLADWDPARSVPSGDMTSFVLKHADEYPNLAARIVDQWARERNDADFRRAVDLWYARGRDVLPWSFSTDAAETARLLAEYARFERAFEQSGGLPPAADPSIAARSVAGTGDEHRRWSFLSLHADEYPFLMEVRYQKESALAAAARPKIAGGPFTTGSSGSGSSTSSRSSRSSTMSSGTTNRSTTNRGGNNRSSRNAGNEPSSGGGFGGQGGFGGSNSGGFGGGGGFGGNSGFGGGGFGSGSGSSGFGSGSSGSGSSGSRSTTNRINSSNSGG